MYTHEMVKILPCTRDIKFELKEYSTWPPIERCVYL